MSWWLHVVLVYPLASVGAVVMAGLLFLVIDPGHSQRCAHCGALGQFPERGLQGVRVCTDCGDRLESKVAARLAR